LYKKYKFLSLQDKRNSNINLHYSKASRDETKHRSLFSTKWKTITSTWFGSSCFKM